MAVVPNALDLSVDIRVRGCRMVIAYSYYLISANNYVDGAVVLSLSITFEISGIES